MFSPISPVSTNKRIMRSTIYEWQVYSEKKSCLCQENYIMVRCRALMGGAIVLNLVRPILRKVK